MEILDYLKWRGDLTFEERELNELDAYILSMILYEDFEHILYQQKTLKDVSDIYFKLYSEDDLKKRATLTRNYYPILKAAANTKRFESLILSQYINDIDIYQDLQFCALTCQYKNKFKFIVFRGTDDTLVGWKEDFKMTYVNEILSQKKAVDYIMSIDSQDSLLLKNFGKMDYYVGGHSKGGNLALYASGHAPSKLQKRIKKIYCFDSPGFNKDVWNDSMQSIALKAENFVPTSSFIGRMFEHKEKMTIVKAKQFGLLQHDLLNWHIDIDHFLYDQSFSDISNRVNDSMNHLLENIDAKEKEEAIESLFDIFENQCLYTFEDLTKININHIIQGIKDFNDLSSNTKKIVLELLKIIIELNTSMK